ncbi:hypothetical protein LTSEMIS_4511, partial [Salmonella enterica subsp. enterica serovar Mississippi str. A4-633]
MQDGFSGWHGCTLPKRNHFTHYCVLILREQNHC